MQKKLKHKLMLPGFALILSTSFLNPSVFAADNSNKPPQSDTTQTSDSNQNNNNQNNTDNTTNDSNNNEPSTDDKRIHLNLLILIKMIQIHLTKIKIIQIIILQTVVKMIIKIQDKMMVLIQMITLIQTVALLITTTTLEIKMVRIRPIMVKINLMMTRMMGQMAIKILIQTKINRVQSQMIKIIMIMEQLMVIIQIKMDKTNLTALTIQINQGLTKMMAIRTGNRVQAKIIINHLNQAIINRLQIMVTSHHKMETHNILV